MRTFSLCTALAALVLLSACARARVTTTIQKDGSWTRSLTFTGQAKKEGGTPNMGPTVQEVFAIPSGAAWKSKQETKKDDLVITVERVMAAGASLNGDLSLKDDKSPGKMRLVNQATVTRAGPRRYEYRETLKWKGGADHALGDIKPEDLAKIKADLPPAVATDENASALAQKVKELAIPMMFGPGDPLLAIGLIHPDLAERRASQRMGTLLVQALEQQFGDKLTLVQRREVARKMIQETFSSMKVSAPDPSSGPQPPANSSGMTPLMFIVKTGGRIISSNGEVDDLSGEVYWAMFEEAASFKDVIMTAIVEMPN